MTSEREWDKLAEEPWPERGWLSIEELIRALVEVQRSHLGWRLALTSYEDSNQVYTRAELSVGDNYASWDRIRTFADAMAAHGFFIWFDQGSNEEGFIHVGLGTKRINSISVRNFAP